MDIKVELKQLIGKLSTAIGVVEQPQTVDAIIVNGVLGGYILHDPGARVFGLRPEIPKAVWPEVVAAVKKLRPDIDDSEFSGVGVEAARLALQEDDEETDDDE